VVALEATVIGLFAVQNSGRATVLSLDLYVAAWQLAAPVSIPALLGGAFVAGLFFAAVPLWVRGAVRARRIRQLEQQLALASSDGGDGGWR
jgi:Flp pilus assembly protein TadB